VGGGGKPGIFSPSWIFGENIQNREKINKQNTSTVLARIQGEICLQILLHRKGGSPYFRVLRNKSEKDDCDEF
jgi:hypothetical protein